MTTIDARSLRRTLAAALAGGAVAATAGAAAAAAAPRAVPGGAAVPGAAECVYTPTPDNPPARPVEPPTPTAEDAGTVEVILRTNHGDVMVRLDRAGAPCAVHSLVHLARSTFYDRSRCWRLTTAARLGVLQCGDIWEAEVGGPGYRFADELTGAETYPKGTVAMGNQGKDTNGSQFFLVHSVAQIRPDYTVLGRVAAGMDVLERIAAAGTKDGAPDGQPKLPVEIRQVLVGAAG